MKSIEKLYVSFSCLVICLLQGILAFGQVNLTLGAETSQPKSQCNSSFREGGSCCPKEEPVEPQFCCIPIAPVQEIDHYSVQRSQTAVFSTFSFAIKEIHSSGFVPFFSPINDSSKPFFPFKQRQAWLCCYRI
ncbi:hypothetical protein [Sediminitomix flava]|uniref:Uncharacterized protein n=1 Tax=Sediminitomix flava TaxID=379075 RepID=A0A315Z8U4_SEDFL|nr:hypothetical protein [Sediminitomix flava]PWJ41078.1 hypothetical protein BC781_104353 [Sediminitomix flava]